jgi:hypothetical protein
MYLYINVLLFYFRVYGRDQRQEPALYHIFKAGRSTNNRAD